MDKKQQLQFNLNNFLLSISLALDLVEKDICNTKKNHSKRVAFIALKIGQRLNLTPQEMSDLCAYSLVHNIALNKEKDYDKKHFELAQELVDKLPFLCGYKNVMKYHQENFDGTGVFGKVQSEIPLFSQIISFAHHIDIDFDLTGEDIENRKGIVEFLGQNEELLFSKEIVDAFLDIASTVDFWLDIQSEHDILFFIFGSLHDFTITPTFEEVLEYTSIFMNLNDENEYFIGRCTKMAEFYEFEHKDKYTFLIAASLYNIGKLAVPNKILEKKEKLTSNEYEVVKAYPYYTKKILSNLIGFNDITNWASRAQETIDGEGYPYKLTGKDLSLKDRLLAVLNVYQSLRTKKSYREAYSHKTSISMMRDLAKNKKIDISIVNDIALELED